MFEQITLWSEHLTAVPESAATPKPPKHPRPVPAVYDVPTSVVVSVSGSMDGSACAIWARQRWPNTHLILWHAHIAEMDWDETDEQLVQTARVIGNCTLIVVQALYQLNGTVTATGANGTTLAGLRIVRHGEAYFGPAVASGKPDEILTLLDFALKARNGAPPTSKIRWCTSYFKAAACNRWLRDNKNVLGERCVLLTGERHAESSGRSKLPASQWRFGTKEWDVLWHRPVLSWKWHEAVRVSVNAGVPLHVGYFAQGETLAAMLDANRDERGRARISCICCIFSHQHHIKHALEAAPATVGPKIEAVQRYEQETGFTWQQRGAMVNC